MQRLISHSGTRSSLMHLTTLITSVDYADFLQYSLPAACQASQQVYVLTSPEDHATQALVDKYPNATSIVTKQWWHNKASFAKGHVLSETVKALASKLRWLLLLDADTVLPADAKQRFDAMSLNKHTLYGARRLLCKTEEEWKAFQCSQGELPIAPLPEIRTVGKHKMIWNYRTSNPAALEGYFQLWNYRTCPKPIPPSKTAANYDDQFAMSWPEDRRAFVPDESFRVVHLGIPRKNWNGRVTPKWMAAT